MEELLSNIWHFVVDVTTNLWSFGTELFHSLSYPLQFPFVVIGLVLAGQLAMLLASGNALQVYFMFGWEADKVYAFFGYLWATVFILLGSVLAAEALGAPEVWYSATLVVPLIAFYAFRALLTLRYR